MDVADGIVFDNVKALGGQQCLKKVVHGRHGVAKTLPERKRAVGFRFCGSFGPKSLHALGNEWNAKERDCYVFGVDGPVLWKGNRTLINYTKSTSF